MPKGNDVVILSIFPCRSKIFERQQQLRPHIARYDDLPKSQSGFRPDHDCATVLADLTDNILGASDKGKHPVLVLLDFSKASYTLNYNLLLLIHRYSGLSSAVPLIRSYIALR